jgi:hypothetical protein
MKFKSILLLAALLFLPLPQVAGAASIDTEYCATPYPKWWWNNDGLRGKLAVQHWRIEPVSTGFRIAFDLVNTGSTAFTGGMTFAVTHAAVDPVGYPNPASGAPPTDARALLGTEVLAQGTLPSLRAGEAATVYASARSFRTDANHLITVTAYDSGLVPAFDNPEPTPWWRRILRPIITPGYIEAVDTTVEPVTSRLPGFDARRIRVTLRNVGRTALAAGMPVAMVHGNAAAAVGYWNPDDVVDLNNPGNPYAIFFRETLYRGRLERTLYPGESLTLEGTAFIPTGITTAQQVAVEFEG